MATWDDNFSIRTTHLLELVITEGSTDPVANTSSVTAKLQINPPSDSTSWSLISSDNTYSMTFEGQTYSGNFTFDFRTDRSTKVLKTVTKTVTHNPDGTGDAQASGSVTTSDGSPNPTTIGNASISTKTLTLTDFVRVPDAPSGSPTLSRSSDGGTITVTSQVATSGATITDYEARYQPSGGSTWTTVSLGTDRTGTFAASPATTTFLVETRAVSSEGNGAWSATNSIVGIPTAPATITANRTGRNVTVTAGTATGTGITGYFVQYSTNGGSTWSTAVAMTSQAYTYSNLTPALTYRFRAYATNAIGNSAFAVSADVFVPAGGKRWDGSNWVPAATGKRWSGSAWTDLATAKRWTGSAWEDLS